MKIVRIDVDGVIADLQTPWINRINAQHGCSVTIEDIVSWEMHKHFPPSVTEEDIFEHLHDLLLYDEVLPYEGALEGIENLYKAGFTPIYVTSSTAAGAYGKMNWLQKHGFVDAKTPIPQDVVIAHRKSYVLPETPLVDDAVHNIIEAKVGLLMDRPWNRNELPPQTFGGKLITRRVKNWEEILDEVRHHYGTKTAYSYGTRQHAVL